MDHWLNNLTDDLKKRYRIMYPNFTYEQMYDRMISRFGIILSPPQPIKKEDKEKIEKYKKSLNAC